MSDELPHSVWSGSFTVFGVELKCHVLSNGKRIIEAESVHTFLKALETPGSDPGDITEFAKWRRG